MPTSESANVRSAIVTPHMEIHEVNQGCKDFHKSEPTVSKTPWQSGFAVDEERTASPQHSIQCDSFFSV